MNAIIPAIPPGYVYAFLFGISIGVLAGYQIARLYFLDRLRRLDWIENMAPSVSQEHSVTIPDIEADPDPDESLHSINQTGNQPAE